VNTYLIIYLIIFFFIIINFKPNKKTNNFFMYIFSIFFILFIGLRYEVGGDWINYEYMYNNQYFFNQLFDSIAKLDFKNFLITLNQINLGFDTFTSISRTLNLGLYGLNILNASILIFGLYFYTKNKNNQILIYLISFPILIIIVGMGYTRQASALGLLFISIKFIENGQIKRSIIFLILAFLFHKTVLVFSVVYLFYFKKINVFMLIFIIFIGSFLYIFYFGKQINHIIYYYLGAGNDFISIGALPRTSLYFIASIIFLLNSKKFVNDKYSLKLYSSISIIIIFMFPIVIIFSTALDRILIYFFVIQLLVFSQVSNFFKSYKNKYLINVLVGLFFLSIMFVWLYFGKYSNHWIPYQNYLFLKHD